MKPPSLTYKQSGVNYDTMDPFKLLAQKEGIKTIKNLYGTGMKEVSGTRGESAYVLEMGDSYIAMVQEGLGTKSLVANAMYQITGKTYYDSIAQDTVATIVNDLITVGAKPTTILAYWSAGSPKWYEDKKRMHDLVLGWARACELSGTVWGGGETQTSQGIINSDAIDLAGTAFGIIEPKSRITIGNKLKTGDSIVILESSGIHANGLTLARKIAEKLPKGYATLLSSRAKPRDLIHPNIRRNEISRLPSVARNDKTNITYGEALLIPTIIYAKLIEDLYKHHVNIHYMTHITGHGFRKIMRHSSSFTYRIHAVPPIPQVLQFIMKQSSMSEKEAYGTFNMGAGYAIFVPEKEAEKVLKISKKHKIKACHAGSVEKGKKQVIIEQKNITFEGESLRVRA